MLAELAHLPGGPQLLALAADGAELALVGGAVRDILLERAPRELDVSIAGDAAAFAAELGSRLGASVTAHGRFGTAVVQWEAGRVDVAARRAESYAAPGALPDVRPGSIVEDLARRDFTVNALAVPLAGARRGELDAAPHALDDLAAGRLRVLHDASFREDPTRILRLARYAARLDFAVERRTAELAAAALAAGALDTVSRARVGAELRLALGEAAAVASLDRMQALGALAAIAPGCAFDARLAEEALALLGDGDRADLLLLAVAVRGVADAFAGGQAAVAEGQDHVADGAKPGGDERLRELLDGFELPAGERDRVLAAVRAARRLPGRMAQAAQPSQLARLVRDEPPEGVALAGALGSAADRTAAAQWLDSLRRVRLHITGDDLLAAGVAPGPQVGARLQAALARKLDGELEDGPAAELDAALRAVADGGDGDG